MFMLNSTKRVASAFAVIAVVISLLVPPVAAAESGQAFSISPPLIDIKADPGQTVMAKIKLTNISRDALLIKTQINDFGAKNEKGDPKIIFDEAQTLAYSLRRWIASPPPFKVASNETKVLEFPIKVPADAEPGGHYAVIRFTGSSPELEQSGVALSASIGSLVLLQVSGNIQEKASIAEFYSATPKFAKSSFFENGPLAFVSRVHNDGNVHLKPSGTVDVFNTFGKKIATVRVNGDPADVKNPPKSVLPQSTRRFETTLDKTWMFGRYEAKLSLGYGQGKNLSSSVYFWVIPYKTIAIITILLTGLFFAGRFGLKKYNAHIIRKARGTHKKK